jgi:hypothetical protein
VRPDALERGEFASLALRTANAALVEYAMVVGRFPSHTDSNGGKKLQAMQANKVTWRFFVKSAHETASQALAGLPVL